MNYFFSFHDGLLSLVGPSHSKTRAEDIIIGDTAEDADNTRTRVRQEFAYTRSYSRNGPATPGPEEQDSTDRSPNLTTRTSRQERFESHFSSKSRATTPNPTTSRTYYDAPGVQEPKMPQPRAAYTPPFRPSSTAGSQYNRSPSRNWTTTRLSPDDRRTPGLREMHSSSPLSTVSHSHVQLDVHDANDRRFLRTQLNAEDAMYEMRVGGDMYGHPAASSATFAANVNGAELHQKRDPVNGRRRM